MWDFGGSLLWLFMYFALFVCFFVYLFVLRGFGEGWLSVWNDKDVGVVNCKELVY